MRNFVMLFCTLHVLVLYFQVGSSSATPYYGALIGDLSTIHHQVSGAVYAASATKLLIRGFTYDGSAPDAFFWIGDTDRPDSSGTILPIDPSNPEEILGQFNNADVELELPIGTTVTDFKWLAVWCRQFAANFGDLVIPASFEAPAIHDLGVLPTYAHQVRADSVKVLDIKTFRFENLYYDGNGPDVYFWAGTTPSPTSAGIRLIWKPNLPATGSNQRVDRRFSGDTVTVTMPEGMTVRDINYVGLWCVIFRSNFGHVSFTPSQLNVPAVLPEKPFDHCEVLSDNEFQVQWRVTGTSLKVQLAGRVTAGNYMAFGLSGSDTSTLMDGSDVVVTWMDQMTMSPKAVDYRLQSKAQCTPNNGNGACPDDRVGGINNAAVDELLSGNGITRITYSKPLTTGDAADKVLPIDRPVFISWALGPINPDMLVAKHNKAPLDNVSINFGRQGTTSCPQFTSVDGGGTPLPPWPSSSIDSTTKFTVDIGQAGGERGYTAITGMVGWGIAWYVNQLLIPEITVQRGTTYMFEVFGGNDPTISARYHPFYITDDPQGGHEQKTEAEKGAETIYAGPIEGPYCEWEQLLGTSPNNYDDFISYRSTLQRNCYSPSSSPGILTWTPDGSTPDLVYYQCYTHRFLGWKIHVVDVEVGTMPGMSGTSPVPQTVDMQEQTGARTPRPPVTSGRPEDLVTTAGAVASVTTAGAVASVTTAGAVASVTTAGAIASVTTSAVVTISVLLVVLVM